MHFWVRLEKVRCLYGTSIGVSRNCGEVAAAMPEVVDVPRAELVPATDYRIRSSRNVYCPAST